MPNIKPEKLTSGDTIGVIAPASRPTHPGSLDNGIRTLESLGFQVKIAPHALDRHGFLAGTDTDRLSDLHAMFSDPAVNGIICLRGGYGSARLLPYIDFELIRTHPKVFVGYSDITVLNNSFYQKTGLITFWGPMISSEMSPIFEPYNQHGLLKAITRSEPIGLVEHPSGLPPVQILHAGKATGRLIGGTLSLLCAVLGTTYDIYYDETILFFEEVGEEPHRIDRMLTQLAGSGVLDRAAAIVCGEFPDCDDPSGRSTARAVLAQLLDPFPGPVVFGLPTGHTTGPALTVPLGGEVQVVGDGRAKVVVTEAAVS